MIARRVGGTRIFRMIRGTLKHRRVMLVGAGLAICKTNTDKLRLSVAFSRQLMPGAMLLLVEACDTLRCETGRREALSTRHSCFCTERRSMAPSAAGHH